MGGFLKGALLVGVVGLFFLAWVIISQYKQKELAEMPAVSEEEENAKERENKQMTADMLISGIIYIQDPRMLHPTCFAYSEDFGFTSISCERIPPELLIIANIDDFN